ncbi:MAG: hypothetical protein HZB92_01785 [Euryarchaeota archaeon]|nr:hypothetical protein [Euryarchaeota archaeon]
MVVELIRKLAIGAIAIATALLFLSPATHGALPSTWTPGDEAARLNGHRFSEEYWTTTVNNTTQDGGDVSFTISYMSYGNESSSVQAFLLAFNKYVKDGNTSTIPYQLFGMHFYTPEGQEIFIGAILAFLMAYDDTYNGTGAGQNNLPDPGHEKIYYVLPFGISDVPAFPNYTVSQPTVTPIDAQKVGSGHYKFGMRYQNLYCFVSENPLASLIFRTGWIALISEFTVTYDVTIDEATKTVKAETYYTIGQIKELWLFLVGVPIAVSPYLLPSTLGLAAVHYTAIFASNYKVADKNGQTINTGIQAPVDKNLTIQIGNRSERALEIGFRGDFDLLNESANNQLVSTQPAYNVIVPARASDLTLVAWQAGFSLDAMCLVAYGLSKTIRQNYTSPLDLRQNGYQRFQTSTLWYAVAFPGFHGLRIVHDPTYTAYTNVGTTSARPRIPGVEAAIVVGAVSILACMTVSRMRRKRGQKH